MNTLLRRSLALLSLTVLALHAPATVTINSGTVTLTNPNLAGAGEEVQLSNATLDLNGQTNVIAGQISLLGGFAWLTNNDTAHPASYAGPIVIDTNTFGMIGGSGDLTLSGPFHLDAGQFEASGGTVHLTGTGTGAGGTVIIGSGLLDIGNRQALGDWGDFHFNGGALRLASGDYRTGSGYYFTSAAYDVQIDVAAGQTARVANFDFSTYGAGFIKTGAGTLSINNNALYTTISVNGGPTHVDGGTLSVDGTLTNTTVFVASGATLSGTGTISGPTTLASGAHLAPGNSPGTLTFTDGLTLNDGAMLDFQLGATSDLIRVSGGTLAGSASADGITLNLSDAGGFGAHTYILFDFTGATPDSFDVADFTLGTTIAGYDYSFNLTSSSLELIATASAIPEPSAYAALAGLGSLGLAAWRRRRRVGTPQTSTHGL